MRGSTDGDSTDDASTDTKRQRPRPPGLSERCPDLPVVEEDAPLPESPAEQVAAGALVVERAGHFVEEMVTVPARQYIRRVYEICARPADAVASSEDGLTADTPVDQTPDVPRYVALVWPWRGIMAGVGVGQSMVDGWVAACDSIVVRVIEHGTRLVSVGETGRRAELAACE